MKLTRNGRKKVTLAEGQFYTAGHFYKDGKSQLFINSEAGEKVQFRLAMTPDEAIKTAQHLMDMAEKARVEYA